MLTQETKRKIDSARNILVGKVPDPKAQVEQITTALIYKFMDDMDKEATELGGRARFFTKGFEKYAWTKLLDQKLGGHERLELYGEAVAKMSQNPHIPQLFRDIFKDAFLPYRSPETLTLFLKEINDFTYNHSEDLGNAFEYLLSILGSQGDAGQFRTPRHIIDFIVSVLDPKKNETICDPACGTAGFLISAYKHIIRQNDGVDEKGIPNNEHPLTPDEKSKMVKNLTGYDISPDMVKLSKVNMYLHGFVEPKIFEYDTLSSEEKWDETFDVIMANPPFMSPSGGIRPHKRFSVQANRAEVLFVDYIKEHLRPNGRAGIIVPEGIIFQSSGAYKQLRKMLVEDGLFAVVSLPQGVFNPYAGVKTSILFFDNALSKKTDKILFVRVLNDGFDLGAQRRPIDRNDLVRPNDEVDSTKVLIGQREAIETGTKNPWLQKDSLFAYEITKEQIAQSGDYNLSAERYRLDNLGEQKNQKWPMAEVGEIAEVIAGQSPEGKYYNSASEGLPFYQGKTEFGDMYLGDQTIWTSKTTKVAEKGDILMSVRAPVGPVNIATQKICIGRGLATIKAGKDVERMFLFYNLRAMQDKIKGNSGAVFDSINKSQIEKIKIPLPPLAIQKQIVAELDGYAGIITGAKQITQNWKPKIDINPQWEKVKLGEVAKLMTGGTPLTSKKEYYGGDIKWLVSGDINQGEIFDCEGRITALALKESNARLLPINSVLIALNGQGKTRGTVAILRTEAACNQSLVSIIPAVEKLLQEFLLYVLKGKYQEIRDINGDNQRGGLNMPIIRGIKIPLPPLAIQKQIVEKIEAERALVESSKKLIEIYEQKTKEAIVKLWTE